MKKKFLILVFMIMILNLSNIVLADESDTVATSIADLDISAGYVGVYTVNDFRALYEQNAYEEVPIASITKIMTAIVCIENIEDLDETVEVNLEEVQNYYDEEYSVAGLKDGETVTYYDLLATMLLPSGADSASCIALSVFDDYDTFIEKMNEKAKEIGMEHTSFANSIGADDENNYSTVYDVAVMMKYALENETLKELMTIYEYTTTDGQITIHNALFQLANLYGIDVGLISGGKTGMTGDAGYCLASYSENLDEPLICIVLGSQIQRGTLNHLTDTETIYEYIKENYSMQSVVEEGDEITTLPTYYSNEQSVTVKSSGSIEIYVDDNEEIISDDITFEYSGITLLSSINKSGDVVGEATVYYAGDYVGKVEVVLDDTITFSMSEWSKENIKFVIIMLTVILMIIILLILSRRKRYKYKKVRYIR